MPRPGPRKSSLTMRLSAEGQVWMDQRATEEGLVTPKGRPNRSELLRIALAYYQRHAPKGWRP